MPGRKNRSITISGIRHLESIGVWQKANGDFRRLPPTSYNRTLTMWVNQCRSVYRQGTLAPSTAEALIELGVCMDPVSHGIQPMPQAYDDALRVIDIVRNGGSDEDLAEDAAWRSDEFVAEWAARMQATAARRPNAPLVKDIRRMLPVFFEEVIEPYLGDGGLSDAQSRRSDDVLEDILGFEERASRLPSMFAAEVVERRLASWLVRWDKGLTGRRAQSQERSAAQTELLLNLREAIGRADAMDRRAEWHWWSMCAKSVLNVPGVGTRWHSLVFVPSPKTWSKKLMRNPFHDWKAQTSVDAVALKIEEPWRIGIAIEEVLGKCSDDHAQMRAMESRAGPVVGVARQSR